MYRKDLSRYEYDIQCGFQLLYVGWIDRGMPFPTGEAPAGLAAKFNMVRYSRYPASFSFALTRGYHYCSFCRNEDRPRSHGEVMIPDSAQPDLFYSANELVGHYIENHGYLPPAEFIRSVFAIDLTKSFDAVVMFDSMLLSKEKMRELYEARARARKAATEADKEIMGARTFSGEYYRYQKWLDENPL